MAISQLEIVTGCLFIAVMEKENTNWILSDGGRAGRVGGGGGGHNHSYRPQSISIPMVVWNKK